MMKRRSQNSCQYDGYLRLTLPELASMHLVHLHSAQDISVKGMLDSLCIPCRHAGYTEWWVPAIHLSIGWDWYVDAMTAQLHMAPWDLRSNVMLVTPDAMTDMGAQASHELLRQHLCGLAWQQQLACEFADGSSHLNQIVAHMTAPPVWH